MIEYWLTFNSGAEKLRLPVPPRDFEMATGMNNTTVANSEIGEINLIGKPRLKTITLSSYFPVRADALCQYTDFPSPAECMDRIGKWRVSGKPIRLLIVGDSLKVNEAMSIESFQVAQKPGPQDIYFSLELKEYRFLSPELDRDGATDALTLLEEYIGTRPVERQMPKTYMTQPGDSLWSIARRFYYNASRAEELRKRNALPDELILPAGKVLML